MTLESRQSSSAVGRGATIELNQHPDGYWLCSISVRVPGWNPHQQASGGLPSAQACIEWANLEIARHVAYVTANPPIWRAPA